MESSSLV
jgi:predicted PurR-regulated permease PerM